MNKRKQKQFKQLSANVTVEQVEKMMKDLQEKCVVSPPQLFTVTGRPMHTRPSGLLAAILGSPPMLSGHSPSGVILDDIEDTPLQVGDLVTRSGTDVHLVRHIGSAGDHGEFECVVTPRSGWCAVGDVESNLCRRYRRLSDDDLKRVQGLLPDWLHDMALF